MAGRLWIDTHTHVSNYNADGTERKHLVKELVAVLDREGPESDLRLLISPDGAELFVMGEAEGGTRAGNEFIYDVVKQAPGRLYGSCMVNPIYLDEALATMDLCLGLWGFVQLGEMLQYMMGYDMYSDEVVALVKRAQEFEVPVQVHISTSNRGAHPSSFGIAQLEDLSRLVEKVPGARYILGHAVGMPDDNPPVVDAYLDFIDQRFGCFPENFWLEIRDFNSPGVRSVLQRVPPDHLLAGTDWTTRVGPPFLPYGVIFGVEKAEDNPYPPGVPGMVACLRQAGASEEVIEMIASGNARELYKLQSHES